MFGVDAQTRFQMLGGFFKIVSFQVLYSELTLCFIVFGVQLNYSFIDWDGLVSHVSNEVESFCESEIGWY